MTATDKMALNSLYRCETISSIILMDYMREENERANNQFKLLKDNEQGDRERREELTTMETKRWEEMRLMETALETRRREEMRALETVLETKMKEEMRALKTVLEKERNEEIKVMQTALKNKDEMMSTIKDVMQLVKLSLNDKEKKIEELEGKISLLQEQTTILTGRLNVTEETDKKMNQTLETKESQLMHDLEALESKIYELKQNQQNISEILEMDIEELEKNQQNISQSLEFDIIELKQNQENITLTPGPKGEPGVSGTKGERGERGMKGEPGSVGSRGPVGPQGSKGATGQKGDMGIKGSAARRGLDLRGGDSSYGNVFVTNSKGYHGPVCDDYWDDKDAAVVCR